MEFQVLKKGSIILSSMFQQPTNQVANAIARIQKISETSLMLLVCFFFFFSPKPRLRSLKPQSEYLNHCFTDFCPIRKNIHLEFFSAPCSVKKKNKLKFFNALYKERSPGRDFLDRGKVIKIQHTYKAHEDYLQKKSRQFREGFTAVWAVCRRARCMVLFTEQPLHPSSPASLWVKELAIFQKRMHFRKMRTVLKKSLMLEKVAPEPMSGCAIGFAKLLLQLIYQPFPIPG